MDNAKKTYVKPESQTLFFEDLMDYEENLPANTVDHVVDAKGWQRTRPMNPKMEDEFDAFTPPAFSKKSWDHLDNTGWDD